VAAERDGEWQPVFAKAFFDLTRETSDTELLAGYPQDVSIWLRGSLAEIEPFLVDEAGQPFPAGAWGIDPTGQVLAHGRAVDPGEAMQLFLEELYVFDNNGCVTLTIGGEQCFYW